MYPISPPHPQSCMLLRLVRPRAAVLAAQSYSIQYLRIDHRRRLGQRGPALSQMPDKPLPTDLPVHFFDSPAAFETFLDREHTSAPGIYLKLARKASGITSITVAEAIEIVLCFGWIDGQARGLDETFYLLRFTPRRSKSLWSKKNVDTIGRLLEGNRVRPAGLAAVDAAKADGRWERAYAGPATMTVPEDLSIALASEPDAAAVFEKLNKTDRYSVLWRVQTATPQNRAKRIQGLVQKLKDGQKIGARETKKEQTNENQKKRQVKKAVSRKATSNKHESNRESLEAKPSIVADQGIQEPRRTGLRPRK